MAAKRLKRRKTGEQGIAQEQRIGDELKPLRFLSLLAANPYRDRMSFRISSLGEPKLISKACSKPEPRR